MRLHLLSHPSLPRLVAPSLCRTSACALLVAALLACVSAATAAAQDQPSGSGHPDAGEPSIWSGVLGFLGWLLLGLVVVGFLFWTVLRRDRGAPSSSGAAAGDRSPRARPAAETTDAAPGGDPSVRDLTVLTFEHTDGAERAMDQRRRVRRVSPPRPDRGSRDVRGPLPRRG